MHQLDTSGLQCPLPVLKANKYLKSMQNGEQLTIIATDPHADIDFPEFCKAQNYKLISRTQNNQQRIFVIEK